MSVADGSESVTQLECSFINEYEFNKKRLVGRGAHNRRSNMLL
jgi:hypothetical protein